MNLMMEKLKAIIRKPFLLILLLVLPAAGAYVGQMFLQNVENDVKIPVAIADEDQSKLSKEVIQRVTTNERIKLIATTADEGEKKLLRNEVDSLFIVREGFMDNIKKEDYEETIELVKMPASVATSVVEEVIASEVTRLSSNSKAAIQVERLYERYRWEKPETLWEDAYRYTDEQWKPEPLMTIQYVTDGQEGAQPDEKQQTINRSVPLWGFLTLVVSLMAMEWVLKEKGPIFKRMKTFPKGVMSYVYQSVAAYGFVLIIQTVLSFFFFLKVGAVTDSRVLLLMLIYLCFCLAFSFWLATESRHLGRYYTAGFLIAMMLSIIGGVFFPISDIAEQLGAIATWIPQHLLVTQQLVLAKELWIQLGTILVITILLWLKAVWNVRSIT
ncbi:ABC transporter permease [Priestia flexa]|jgi:ABC-2 type transport system permease protein|uniref:ABC transporter permease n=1 Tax=Priestia flexa TaxID=86664 RepID=A0A8I1SPB3_9BACI|nr:ABC transporter permease [Priestia flexa]MBN8252618.1 ABC transporter permease [Priestia flexa]RIV11793.1 ABC transporter permease [Priestia flexa]